MIKQRERSAKYVVGLGLCIAAARWLLAQDISPQARTVLVIGTIALVADLIMLQCRLLCQLTNVPTLSRIILLGSLVVSTAVISLLTLPHALASDDWLTDCATPLRVDVRFGNYGPDYVVTHRIPFDVAPSTVNAEIHVFDGYDGRADSYVPEQLDESLRIEFYLDGHLQGSTAASPDLPDEVNFADWLGVLGAVELPDGADEVVIAHPGWFAGLPQANSVRTDGVCLAITPYPIPTPPTTASPVPPPTTTQPAPPSTTTPRTTPPTATTTSISEPLEPTPPASSTSTTWTTTSTSTSTTSTSAPTTMPPTTLPSTPLPATATTTSTTATTTSSEPPKVPRPARATTSTTTTPATPNTPNVPPRGPRADVSSTTFAPTTSQPPSTSSTTTAPPLALYSPPPPNLTQPPPADRIGKPPSQLAYTGATVTDILTAGWLCFVAGLSLFIGLDGRRE